MIAHAPPAVLASLCAEAPHTSGRPFLPRLSSELTTGRFSNSFSKYLTSPSLTLGMNGGFTSNCRKATKSQSPKGSLVRPLHPS